ncbi:hypothetical protein NKG94_02475 [Micromonospora sp. M12]
MTLALGGLVGLGATPAAADPPGGTLRNVYPTASSATATAARVRTGLWSWYYCEYRQYGPTSPGFYFLWTFTY